MSSHAGGLLENRSDDVAGNRIQNLEVVISVGLCMVQELMLKHYKTGNNVTLETLTLEITL